MFWWQGLDESAGSGSPAEARQGWYGQGSVPLGLTGKEPTAVYAAEMEPDPRAPAWVHKYDDV